MIRVKARYRNQILELDQPLNLADGTEVQIDIHTPTIDEAQEAESWRQLGMERLEQEWDNPEDAAYDDWRKLYGGDSR